MTALAAKAFPALAAVDLDTGIRGFQPPIEFITEAIIAINAVLPDGAISCDPGGAATVPPPAPPSTFALYNIAWDEDVANTLELQVRADQNGGIISGRMSFDGRCADDVQISWQFDEPAGMLAPGQQLPLQPTAGNPVGVVLELVGSAASATFGAHCPKSAGTNSAS